MSVCMKLSVSVRVTRLKEPRETRSAKKTKCSGAEERTKDSSSPIRRERQAKHMAPSAEHEACSLKHAMKHEDSS